MSVQSSTHSISTAFPSIQQDLVSGMPDAELVQTAQQVLRLTAQQIRECILNQLNEHTTKLKNSTIYDLNQNSIAINTLPFTGNSVDEALESIRLLDRINRTVYNAIFNTVLWAISELDFPDNLEFVFLAIFEKESCPSKNKYLQYLSYSALEAIKEDDDLDPRLFQDARIWKLNPFPSKQDPLHMRVCKLCTGFILNKGDFSIKNMDTKQQEVCSRINETRLVDKEMKNKKMCHGCTLL